MESFVLYTIIFLLLPLFFDNIERGKNRFYYLLFSIGLMWFMTSFRRYDVGNDTEAYHRYFNLAFTDDFNLDLRIEVGYKYLCIVISRYTNNFTIFLVITSGIIFVTLFQYVRKYGQHPFLYISLFWCLAYVPFVSPLRQSLALSVILISLPLLLNKKYFYFLFFCYVASLFHRSALVSVLLIPMMLVKPTNSRILYIVITIMLLVFSNTISYFNQYLDDEYYSRYFNTQSGSWAAFFNTLIGIIPLFLEKTTSIQSKKTIKPSFYILMRWGTIVYSISYLLSLHTSGMGRIAYYFMPFMLSFWCFTISGLSKNNRIMTIILLFSSILSFRIIALLYRPDWNSFFPFYYVWE